MRKRNYDKDVKKVRKLMTELVTMASYHSADSRGDKVVKWVSALNGDLYRVELGIEKVPSTLAK